MQDSTVHIETLFFDKKKKEEKTQNQNICQPHIWSRIWAPE